MDSTQPHASLSEGLSPAPSSPATAASSDRPLMLALASAALSMGASVPVCFAATGGTMPVGHALYVSLLIGLLTGVAGLLGAGLIVTARKGLATLHEASAQRAQRPTPAAPAAGGQLAFD